MCEVAKCRGRVYIIIIAVVVVVHDRRRSKLMGLRQIVSRARAFSFSLPAPAPPRIPVYGPATGPVLGLCTVYTTYIYAHDSASDRK